MTEKLKWAFILDKDEFVRLSLSKILDRYGFQVEEIEDFSQLERRNRDVQGGIILADTEIEVLERWVHLLKKWSDRFVLMTPLVTDELNGRLKKIGIYHVIKKPVEPGLLKRVIRKITPDGQTKSPPLSKKGECSRINSSINQKGGEGT